MDLLTTDPGGRPAGGGEQHLRRALPVALQPAGHLERQDRAQAVPEEGVGQVVRRPPRLADSVGQQADVLQRRFRTPVLATRVLNGLHVDVRVEAGGQRPEEAGGSARVRKAQQPHPGVRRRPQRPEPEAAVDRQFCHLMGSIP